MRILVVEDETKMAALLKRGLEEEGYAVDLASTGTDGLWAATETDYDAIVLDVMLPELDGLRGVPPAPGRRPMGAGLHAHRPRRRPRPGARASTPAPTTTSSSRSRFSELLARAPRAHSARRRRAAGRAQPWATSSARSGHAAALRAGRREIELTARRSSRSSSSSPRNPGEVLSRTQLLEHVWDFAFEGDSNVVDVYVRYLREKVDRPFGASLDRDRAWRRLPAARGLAHAGLTDAPADPSEAHPRLRRAHDRRCSSRLARSFLYVRLRRTLLARGRRRPASRAQTVPRGPYRRGRC